MKVLVIDEWFPWPLESGKKIRTYNLLKRLSEKYEIIYLAYAKLPEENEKIHELSKWCYKVVAVEDSRIEKWTIPFYFKVLRNLFSHIPFSTAYHVRDEYKHRLLSLINSEAPDMIHCEWTNLAPFLEGLDSIPRVISSHNVESDIWKRLYTSNTNVFKKFIAYQQAHRIEKLEKFWYPRVETCLAVSNQDKSVIESYGARVFVVENGVDLQFYDHCDAGSSTNNLIFTASFDTFSNQDGALFFIQQIYPLIKKQVAGVRLMLVGKNPPDRLTKISLSDRTITVTGTVPDVRPYLRDASVCVVPLRIGGGSRLKILEAMAMRRPVVATSIGAEGLEVTDGQNILLADSPEDFANKVVQLLRNKQNYLLLVKHGFDFVKTKYDWSMLAEKQDAAWSIAHKCKLSCRS